MPDAHPPPRPPRVAVLAGAGPGLGAALARRFAAGDCRVALLARSADYLKTLAGEVNATHGAGRALPVPCDLADADSITAAFGRVRAELGSCDVLLAHAAGGGPGEHGGLFELNLESFERAWRVGVLGMLLCAREAARDMVTSFRKGGGAILFTGATSSVRGGVLSFSTAKFATRGLAQALARELWPRGVHVAHVVVDGVIGEPGGAAVTPAKDGDGGEEGSPRMDPDAMAESYWQLTRQHPSAWTLELDLRPKDEEFFT